MPFYTEMVTLAVSALWPHERVRDHPKEHNFLNTLEVENIQ